MSLSDFIKQAGNMPDFLDQNRPKKVKEIYSALKRDHPDMPAEMKARIASRRGKKNAMSRKSPKDGGPKYKAPITTKYKAAAVEVPEGGMKSGPLTTDWTQAMSPEEASLVKEKLPFYKRTDLGVLPQAGLGAIAGGRSIPFFINEARSAMGKTPIGRRGKLIGAGLGAAAAPLLAKAVRRTEWGKRQHQAVAQGALEEAQEKTSSALQKRAADLRNDIVNRALHCGESLEKTAAEEYFHGLRKAETDVEMLGTKFCKLAHGIGKDPWELALEVADNFPAYAVLSKTASDPKARELAEFYLDWSDEMEKTAFLGGAMRIAKAGVKAPWTSAGRMRQATKAVQAGKSAPVARSPMQAMKREAANVKKVKVQGGGSYSRGQKLVGERQAGIAAKRAKPPVTQGPPPAAPAVAPAAEPGALARAGQAAKQGLGTGAKTLIGGGAVAGAVGAPAYLLSQRGQQQAPAAQGYY